MSNYNESEIATKNLSDIVKIDKGKIQSHLGDIVKKSVEETLNELLNKEASSCVRPVAMSAMLVTTTESFTRRLVK